jgi:hypothetical protein
MHLEDEFRKLKVEIDNVVKLVREHMEHEDKGWDELVSINKEHLETNMKFKVSLELIEEHLRNNSLKDNEMFKMDFRVRQLEEKSEDFESVKRKVAIGDSVLAGISFILVTMIVVFFEDITHHTTSFLGIG